MKITFHWEEDPNHCSMCDCCTQEEQEQAEVLTCTASVNGEVMDSLSGICGIPEVTDEERQRVEDEMREEAFAAWMKTLYKRGDILWGQI